MTMSRAAASGLRIAALALLAFGAGASQGQDRFVISADGQEVTDTATRLTWKRCAEGMRWNGKVCSGKAMRYSFAGAKKEAANGAAAWRIPTRDELVALVDKTAKRKPRIDTKAFPQTPSRSFWATRAGSDDNLNAWLVSFSSGRVTGNAGQAKFPLRLVRSAT